MNAIPKAQITHESETQPQARSPANGNAAAPNFRRQLPGLLLVLAVGAVIATLIVDNLYNSLFVIRADDGAVMAPAVMVHATTEGIFHSMLDPGLSLVLRDELIGTIEPTDDDDETAYVRSPCNCYIEKSYIVTGDLTQPGQQIASLVPVDAKPWIVAEMDPLQAKKIEPDSRATISIFGSRSVYTGHVTSMESSLSGNRPGDKSTLMKITTDQKLPVDFVSRVAAVTFDVR
jgi:multidrug resistance efflux pump